MLIEKPHPGCNRFDKSTTCCLKIFFRGKPPAANSTWYLVIKTEPEWGTTQINTQHMISHAKHRDLFFYSGLLQYVPSIGTGCDQRATVEGGGGGHSSYDNGRSSRQSGEFRHQFPLKERETKDSRENKPGYISTSAFGDCCPKVPVTFWKTVNVATKMSQDVSRCLNKMIQHATPCTTMHLDHNKENAP